jgi:phenylpyruvate tautomerase PptA (4-oxalocrotonate tautomerase family)
MPLVRIDLVKSRSEAQIRAVADAVHTAVVEVLAIQGDLGIPAAAAAS